MSYMDGIPVKISEKYKPPRKITLPGCLINKLRHDRPQMENYDFALERSVLEKVSELKKIREKEEEERKAKEAELAQLEEAASQIAIDASTPAPPPPAPLTTPTSFNTPAAIPTPTAISPPIAIPTPTPMPALATIHNSSPVTQSSILTPMPIATKASGQTKREYGINISDFESDTSSPFENMELKAMNDMELLADILGDSNTTSTTSLKANKSGPIQPINGYNLHQGISGTNHLLNYQNWNGYYHHSAHASYHHRPPSNLHSPPQLHPSASFTHTPYPQLQQQQSILPPPPPNPNVALKKSIYDDLRQKVKERQHQVQYVPPPTFPQRFEPQPSSSKTYSPPLTSPTGSLSESHHYPQAEARPRREEPKSSLPNPFHELPHSYQTLAMRVAEMGFPLARCARATQIFSNNEAKVVEFLLQVQSMEEKGYPGDIVEKALTTYNQDMEMTSKYLDNFQQLITFGFSEVDVMEALTKSNNNINAALEVLIS